MPAAAIYVLLVSMKGEHDWQSGWGEAAKQGSVADGPDGSVEGVTCLAGESSVGRSLTTDRWEASLWIEINVVLPLAEI